MDLEEIKALIQLVEKTTLSKLIVKQDTFELHLEKPGSFEKKVSLPDHHEREVELAKKIVEKPAAKDHDFLISPMVGTFYSSPSPDQPPFVRKGDSVKEDTVVGIVEAMKVMNEVKAGRAGVIQEVLIENSQPVEFGSKLFRIA